MVPAEEGAADVVRRLQILLPGVALVAVLSASSIAVARSHWLQASGISALTLAIVVGMFVGNTVYPRIAALSAEGVAFSRQSLLRLGIILYGFRVTFQDIGQVGAAGLLIDIVVLSSTFALAWFLGTRVCGLDRKTAMLIGAGSSICGAAAVMATGPVVGGRAEQVAVAVSTVVVFGTIAIFIYPAAYHLNAQLHLLPMSLNAYGLFAGSTIHEVAQVVVAGHAIGDASANTAVIEKMARVMLLAPFLMLLSAYLARNGGEQPVAKEGLQHSHGKIAVPWFVLLFVAVAGLNSLAKLPAAVISAALDLDTAILAMAMTALGLTTHVSAIRSAGVRPLLLGALLAVWLIVGGLLINFGVARLFAR
jgi:uncharacterized integral membrane protein (TIGR00698 family)